MPEPVSVLLVEDDPSIRMTLQEALEDAGFSVRVAADGKEALAALEEHGAGFHGLITDVNLGVVPDGWDLARRGRELDPRLPVVYLTGGSGHEWASHGVPKSTLVPKPFAVAQVVTAVSVLINEGASGL